MSQLTLLLIDAGTGTPGSELCASVEAARERIKAKIENLRESYPDAKLGVTEEPYETVVEAGLPYCWAMRFNIRQFGVSSVNRTCPKCGAPLFNASPDGEKLICVECDEVF